MTRRITLRSSDAVEFEVYETVAKESKIIKHIIEDDCTNNVITLPKVTSKILSKVLEYCWKHVEACPAASSKASDDISKKAEEELKSWDAEFVKVNQATLVDLFLAANYLFIKDLRDLTRQTLIDIVEGKTPEERRETFNIKNDITPEEEDPWASKPVGLVARIQARAIPRAREAARREQSSEEWRTECCPHYFF